MCFILESRDNLTTNNLKINLSIYVQSFIKKWLAINWQELGKTAAATSMKILISALVFYALYRAGRKAIQLVFKKGINNITSSDGRIETVRKLVLNSFRGIMIFAFLYTVLTIFSIPVGSLLAGAGIFGLAISFGTQGLVADLATGISILIENQLDIGDHVVAANIEGTVTDINLRSTTIKGFDGTIHYIPNRLILTLSNKSQGEMRARISLPLLPNTDLEQVREIIQKINILKVPEHPEIITPPKGIVFHTNLNNQITMIVDMHTIPGKQFGVEATFIEEYVEALTKEGIELPYSTLDRI